MDVVDRDLHAGQSRVRSSMTSCTIRTPSPVSTTRSTAKSSVHTVVTNSDAQPDVVAELVAIGVAAHRS